MSTRELRERLNLTSSRGNEAVMNPNAEKEPNASARPITFALLVCLGTLLPQAAAADAMQLECECR